MWLIFRLDMKDLTLIMVIPVQLEASRSNGKCDFSSFCKGMTIDSSNP